MRILIATGLYAPEVGGPATYTAFLEAYLPKYNMPFIVVPFSRVRFLPKFLRHFWYTILLICASRRGDIFYALDTVSVGLPVLIASKVLRRNYIVRVPGDYAWEQGTVRYGVQCSLDSFQEAQTLPWQVRLFIVIQRWVTCSALSVIVPSMYMRSIVSRWGVDLQRIVCVYSALRAEIIDEDRMSLRKRYGYGDVFTIVSAARLVPWKGMHSLIQVMSSLQRQGKRIALKIIGDGVCMNELREEIDRLGLESCVTLEGMQTHLETLRRIKAADLFVLNTGYEGLSHQLIEVMHSGVPIITTRVGGNIELIEESQAGILIPYNDLKALERSILSAYEHPDALKTYVWHAQERACDFSEERIAKIFVQFLEDTLCT